MSLDTAKERSKKREKLIHQLRSGVSPSPSTSKVVVDHPQDNKDEMTMLHPEKCYWLDCKNPPREGSKYCSDECGIEVAMFRLKLLLPDKVKAMQEKPCVAELKNKQELQELNRQIIDIKMLVGALEEKRDTLDNFIDKVQQIHYEAELEPKDICDDNSNLSCLLCGQDVGLKNYVPHMERCFAKNEKHVISVGLNPTKLPGKKILCEYFDPRARTYCRRLNVLCPDHNKEWNMQPKKGIICGSPLTDEMDIRKVCRTEKSKCRKHFNWETLRRADIDIQKWNAFVKSDILVRKEQQVRLAMHERRSVVGLLVHTTTPEGNADEVDMDISVDED